MKHTCWILTDGRKGTESNALGLAEALWLEPEIHTVALRQPWKSLSPWLRPCKASFNTQAFVPAPPWPDILITAGRTPAVASLYVGKMAGDKTVRIHITNPGIAPENFDMVIAPQHDRLTGDNTITTLGSLHRQTPARLAEAKAKWEPVFNAYPKPWYGLLIGGSTRGLTLDHQAAHEVILPYINEVSQHGGTILATASRRTDPAVRMMIADAIKAAGGYLWDEQGDNPYAGILACAEELAVTADSVSMLSEACSTDKPVWVLPLGGHNPKLERFVKKLTSGHHAQIFTGHLSKWLPVKINDMAWVLPRVRRLLLTSGKLDQ